MTRSSGISVGRGRLALLGALTAVALGTSTSAAQAAGTFTVTSTADTAGSTCGALACTLRQALTAANAAGGGTIDFAIVGSGVQEIQPASPLPTITTPITIDGESQPGYSGTPLIQLDGTNVTAAKGKPAPDGLLITAGPSTVEGLEITHWTGNGIELQEGKSKTTPGNDNTIQANYIGNDGSSVDANGNGVEIDDDSQGNTIGGASSTELNVISANTNDGVLLSGKDVTGNTIEGDYIGTDSTGKNPLGNGNSGVFIIDGADTNTIGGTSAGARDVISGNDPSADNYDQVDIGDSSDNTVEGDYIGPDETGTAKIANGADGVYIYDGAKVNTIGGAGAGAGDVISGNAYSGVDIDDAPDNTVEGDYIGPDETGTTALGNENAGVYVYDAKDNTIGGTTAAARDVIAASNESNDNYDGIDLNKATDNVVEGDYIGTDETGATALENYDDGIDIYDGSSDNTIGGAGAGAGDVISGNEYDGVWIGDSGTSKNVVEGDYIGTDDTGSNALANGDDGVKIANGATDNTIGGTASGAGDVLSANGLGGVEIGNKGTSGNVVEGDYVGTNSASSTTLGNVRGGINIFDAASGNTIGGTASGAGDVISGNDPSGHYDDGVDIDGDGTSSTDPTKNVVEGDYIGTNVAGSAALGNGYDGVAVYDGATGNTIGGTTAAARDVLSGNGYRGVAIDGASKNVVVGDYIGTDATGTTAVSNGHDAVYIHSDFTNSDSADNVIGGPKVGDRDVISAGNGYEGVEIDDTGTTGNVVQGDYIGTNAAGTAALGSDQDGVYIADGATDDTIGGTATGDANKIDYNGNDGVYVDGASTTGNPIETNSIFGNTNLGIWLSSDGDADEPAPTVAAVGASSGKTTITGTVPVSKDTLRIEVFNNPSCTSNTQGQTFLGATTASKGAWKLTVPTSDLGGTTALTATSTDTKTLDTSEFSTPCFS